jgi:hypothetical protein
MNNGTFDFNEFVKESKEVLTDPKSYFTTMKTSGGIAEPLIKALVYGVIAGIFGLLWGILHLSVGGSIFGGAVGVMTFIWSIFGAVIGLFIGAVIVLILSSICKGNTDFEACARVVAAVMVVMPISAFFGFATGLNLYLGLIISLAIQIYSLWLLYNGLVFALKSKPETTRIVSYVLIALFVLVTLAGLGAKRKANQFMNEFNNSDLKELMEDNQ